MSLQVSFGGVTLVKPGAASIVVPNARAPRITGIGNLGLIGEAEAGLGRTLLTFTDPATMRVTFRSGPLADAAGIAFNPANDPRITGQPFQVTCYKVNAGSQAQALINDGGAQPCITLTSKDAGAYVNKINFSIAANVFTGQLFDSLGPLGSFTETSPVLGQTAKLSVWYSGSGTLPVFAISATGGNATNMTLSATGAAGDFLSIDLTSVKTATDLVSALNNFRNSGNSQVWNAALVSNNLPFAPTANLDRVTGIAIGTTSPAATGVFSAVQDFLDWINANSQLVTAARTLPEPAQQSSQANVTPAATGQTFLGGGTLGGSANSDWQNGFNTLGTLRINEIGALAYGDGYISSTALSGQNSGINVNTLYYNGMPGAVGSNLLSVPGGLALSQSLNGNLTALGNYFYKITAINAQGETLPSTEANLTLTGSNKTITLTWNAVVGAVGYKIYRSQVTNTEVFLTQIGQAPGASYSLTTSTPYALTFVDNGSITPGSATVPVSNTATTDSFTITSLLANLDSYAATQSNPINRNEVQAYGAADQAGGIAASSTLATAYGTTVKSAVINLANIINSYNTSISFQRLTLPNASNNTVVLPAWSSAVCFAAMRASAPFGEPITAHYLRAFGVTQDSSFNIPTGIPGVVVTGGSDIPTLILNGVSVIDTIPGKGFRWAKGNTTYTKQNIDAYTEESVVVGWKNLSFNLRSSLEQFFVGAKGTPATVQQVRGIIDGIMQQAKDQELITDSSDGAGNPLNAWRNVQVALNGDTMTVSVEVTMVQGINFVLVTTYLTPVRLAA